MNKLWQNIILIGTFMMMLACNAERLGETKKNAVGDIGNVIISAEPQIWNGPAGDSARYYFETPYPVMLIPEPIFDVTYFSPKDLQDAPLRLNLRTIVFLIDLSDTTSSLTQMAYKDLGAERIQAALDRPHQQYLAVKNKWARNQLIIYYLGKDATDLANRISPNFPEVADRINQHDGKVIANTIYFPGENFAINRQIEASTSAKMKIPADFVLAQNDTSFIWIRRMGKTVNANIIIQKIPYYDTSQFTQEYMTHIRDSLGVQVGSNIENSKMVINQEDLPMFTFKTKLGGQYAIESRGIWELNNDFMGGPFISYLVLMPDQKHLLFLDGFLFAPEERFKKPFMQELEVILSKTTF